MIAKCVTVPAVVAAAVVIAAEFALTDGSASVAGAQFVAPTAVRVSEGLPPPHSDVPFTEYMT